jgi:hypothetical protein
MAKGPMEWPLLACPIRGELTLWRRWPIAGLPIMAGETGMKVALDLGQQNALLGALAQMDSFETVTTGVEHCPITVRVPYKLGASRRVLVKNTNAITAAQVDFESARRWLVREIWPDKPEDIAVAETDEKMPQFRAGMQELIAAKDEIELLPFPSAVIYGAGNEFPAAALATLDQFGLIDGE